MHTFLSCDPQENCSDSEIVLLLLLLIAKITKIEKNVISKWLFCRIKTEIGVKIEFRFYLGSAVENNKPCVVFTTL